MTEAPDRGGRPKRRSAHRAIFRLFKEFQDSRRRPLSDEASAKAMLKDKKFGAECERYGVTTWRTVIKNVTLGRKDIERIYLEKPELQPLGLLATIRPDLKRKGTTGRGLQRAIARRVLLKNSTPKP